MADQLHHLLSLHALAAPYGDGLKPELLALLTERERLAARGAVPLPTRQVSAGPAQQHATDEELAAAGVPRIGRRLERRAEQFETTGSVSEPAIRG
ncbi:MAG: hypothetical protein AAF675_08095 [Pseudomonadota bacterium]